jgi:3-deoxy-D-manno-octulosonic-acid transferase
LAFLARGLNLSELDMLNTYDIAYGLAVGVSAPFWLLKPGARRKVLGALSQRMGHVAPRADAGPSVLIHAVSLGEVNATRGLVDRLRQLRPDLHIVISTTTETGLARAKELYEKSGGASPARPALSVIRYPLDFSSAVRRVLDALRPDAVVLMELEVWPNFLLQCSRRNIPVVLVNGRMTTPSFRRYRLVLPLMRRMFGRLSTVCVQDQNYAALFAELGVGANRIRVTGTMKFDTATVADRVDGDELLANDLGLPQLGTHYSELSTGHRLWVCGSTGPGEEQIILRIYRTLLPENPGLRLAIIPRKPERFDDVAKLITAAGFPLIRRSDTKSRPATSVPVPSSPLAPVILGDTMGELRKFYSLADIVFVGRTLVDLGPRQHGSDMIEPAALGRPVIVGPFTGNFAEAMSRFRAAAAIVEVRDPEQLLAAMRNLLQDAGAARAMAQRARAAVIQEKGATERHAQVILQHLPAAVAV